MQKQTFKFLLDDCGPHTKNDLGKQLEDQWSSTD